MAEEKSSPDETKQGNIIKPETPQETTQPPIETIMSAIRELLTLALGLSAFFIVAGFVVVNSYLDQYTTIRTFQVVTPNILLLVWL